MLHKKSVLNQASITSLRIIRNQCSAKALRPAFCTKHGDTSKHGHTNHHEEHILSNHDGGNLVLKNTGFHFESTKSNDTGKLDLLEKELQKVDEFNKNFNNYNYEFTRLPPNFADNQFVPINKGLQDELQNILGCFDQSPIKYAFGYGSGVFEQKGYSNSKEEKPQIDMIFGVMHPNHWHALNMRANPNHYSSLKYFGSEFVAKFQEIGAGIYFNPFADINGHQVKYGVVSMERLLKDLATWDSFYLAGRLQKPVKVLKNDLRVQYWNQLNLKAAATISKHITLTKNNGVFDEFKFYENLTGLSYLGDIRYKIGAENPKKIQNIVSKNLENFRYYYKPVLKDVFENTSTHLPKGYTLENYAQKLESTIAINSLQQTLKGIFTAGIAKSLKYAWLKKMKAMKKQ
ncbi:Mitochondrial translocator assembly and maintenance protein 41 [Hanseniaspora osmophila]|uniref:Phosphatidate cytidylyltransferase, mitochondrial n=1 Tax=Hanseniaspora osmophila TaxID=56408 RepID=A0A1E5RGJ3_9ASCO|nr:Phosphatidate cytidylyltransferase, mitochondrial [Hanseniaspora osmophila]